MTVIARHMRCDSRKVCSQCSIYLWKPSLEKRYYWYCPSCKHDILCDRGLSTGFIYDERAYAQGTARLCLICQTKVEERYWPPEIEGVRLEVKETTDSD